jgi:hypothetical protein
MYAGLRALLQTKNGVGIECCPVGRRTGWFDRLNSCNSHDRGGMFFEQREKMEV